MIPLSIDNTLLHNLKQYHRIDYRAVANGIWARQINDERNHIFFKIRDII